MHFAWEKARGGSKQHINKRLKYGKKSGKKTSQVTNKKRNEEKKATTLYPKRNSAQLNSTHTHADERAYAFAMCENFDIQREIVCTFFPTVACLFIHENAVAVCEH